MSARKPTNRTTYDRGTYLAAEEYAYPNGGQTRPCMAVYPDGIVRRVWGGIPETYFSIPAHGRFHGQYVTGSLILEQTDDDHAYAYVVRFVVHNGRRIGK